MAPLADQVTVQHECNPHDRLTQIGEMSPARSCAGEQRLMVSEPELRPTLVVNPPDDDDFRSYAEALIEGGLSEPLMLQECLRRRYPLAIVRPRALAGERARIWYVYRDGHWVRSGPRPEHRSDPA